MTASRDITPLFVVNRVVDAMFCYDIKVQFNLAFQEPATKGGKWVLEKGPIRAHYLSFWFWIDIVSVLPIWITNFVVSSEDLAASSASTAV